MPRGWRGKDGDAEGVGRVEVGQGVELRGVGSEGGGLGKGELGLEWGRSGWEPRGLGDLPKRDTDVGGGDEKEEWEFEFRLGLEPEGGSELRPWSRSVRRTSV